MPMFVSDAGAALDADPSPSADWGRHSKRVIDIVYRQVTALRKRQLIASYKLPRGSAGKRSGTYWGSDRMSLTIDCRPRSRHRTNGPSNWRRSRPASSASAPSKQERLINGAMQSATPRSAGISRSRTCQRRPSPTRSAFSQADCILLAARSARAASCNSSSRARRMVSTQSWKACASLVTRSLSGPSLRQPSASKLSSETWPK